MWLRSIMSELHFAPIQPITLYGDNQASISIAKTPVGHTRAKQIDIRYHYLRELAGRAGRSRSLDSSPCLASLQSQIARSSRRPVSFLQPHYLIRSNSHLILGRSHPTLCQPTSLKPKSIELTKFETTVTPLALDAPPASRLFETASSFLTADARKLNKCYQCTLSQQKCSIDRALNRDNFDDQTLDARFDFTEDTSSDSMSIEKEGSVASVAPSFASVAPSIKTKPSDALAALNKAILSLEVTLDDLKATRLVLIQASISKSTSASTSTSSVFDLDVLCDVVRQIREVSLMRRSSRS